MSEENKIDWSKPCVFNGTGKCLNHGTQCKFPIDEMGSITFTREMTVEEIREMYPDFKSKPIDNGSNI